ncbi:MAG: sodium:solute symporter, partial [Saprospiraceae bacterium]
MKNKILKSLQPTAILIILLVLVGLFLKWNGNDVFWAGFCAMVFFYGLIFFIGAYAGQIRKSDSADDVLLAGRSI